MTFCKGHILFWLACSVPQEVLAGGDEDAFRIVECAALFEVKTTIEAPASVGLTASLTEILFGVAGGVPSETSADELIVAYEDAKQAYAERVTDEEVALTGGSPEWMWPLLEGCEMMTQKYQSEFQEQIEMQMLK